MSKTIARQGLRLATPILLSSTFLLTTACGTQGIGVLRNPLGGVAPAKGNTAQPPQQLTFDGNPAQLNTLLLRTRLKGLLEAGGTLPLEVVALDRDGRRIDPRKLNLVFTSSDGKAITVDAQGILTGVTPFESSKITVTEPGTGTTAETEVTVAPKEYSGNPLALGTIQLAMRQQAVPGMGEMAQFEVIARDILGNPIDPTRLNLEWTVSDPNAFQIDKNGMVTALVSTGMANVLVRDPNTGKIASGTIRTVAVTTPNQPAPPAASPTPAPGNNSGPSTPSTNGPGSLPAAPGQMNGDPSTPARITLTPALSRLYPGDSVQLTATVLDAQGRRVDPTKVSLQWVSNTPSRFSVDPNGVVTALTSGEFEAEITVSVPGQGLSATAQVETRPASSGGGGGGGGGGIGGNQANPSIPALNTTPISTSSFDVLITPPSTSPVGIVRYRVVIGNAPGTSEFLVDAQPGPFTFSVPLEAGLNPETTYPVSLIAIGGNNRESAIINGFGSTLPADASPLNTVGGSQDFSSQFSTPLNTALAFTATAGNDLKVGDITPSDVLTVRVEPLQTAFGSVGLTGTPSNGAALSGTGVSGDALVLVGSVEQIRNSLALLAYTPGTGFTGLAEIRISSTDVAQNNDLDILTVNVQDPTPTAPQNLMDSDPAFEDLLTGRNTPITLSPGNGNGLTVSDPNGETVTVTLTPNDGTLSLGAISPGVTVTGTGTPADPFRLVGHPDAVNNTLAGGVTFTPDTNFIGTGGITMAVNDGNTTDTDTIDIEVLEPSNFFNDLRTFPTTPLGVARNGMRTFGDADDTALSLSYPPGTVVQVDLILVDSAGNNPAAAGNGSLSMPSTTGLTTSTSVNGVNLRLSGSITDINTALAAGVIYSPASNTVGDFRLRMVSVDPLNTGLTDTDDFAINVSLPPQNQYNADENAFPTEGSMTHPPLELANDTPLTFASFGGTPLSADDDGPTLTVTLTPSNGTVTRANNNPAPTGVTQTGEGTPESPFVVSGPKAGVNSFLATIGAVYTPPQGFSGPASVTVTTRDQGGLEDIDVVDINVLAPPSNTFNGTPSFPAALASPDPETPIAARPSGALALNSANSRQLGITSYPATANVTVNLSVPSGTLSLGSTSNLTVTGNNSGAVMLRGTQANLNAALATLSYTPAAGAVAEPTLVRVTITSSSGPLGDNNVGSPDQVSFLVSNPPVNQFSNTDTFPGTGDRLPVFANTPLTFNGTPTATSPNPLLSVNDDSSNVTVTLTPADGGMLTIGGGLPNSVNVTGGVTANTAIVISGPRADVNTALTQLTLTPATGFTSTSTLTVVTTDGAGTDTDTLNLTYQVRPLNAYNGNSNFVTALAPATRVLLREGVSNAFADNGDNATLHELGVLNLSSYTGSTDPVTVTLSVPAGAGTLAVDLTGTSVTRTEVSPTHTLTLSVAPANAAQLNTVLNTLTYTPAALGAGSPQDVTLTMVHGPVSDTDTLTLFASRVPVNQLNASGTFPVSAFVVNEGTALAFDAGNNRVVRVEDDSLSITVILTPGLVGGSNSGTVSVPGTSGVTITGSGTNASPLQLVGSPTDVNTALAGLSFTSATGINGTTTLTMNTTDGSGRDNNDSIPLDIRARPANRFNNTNTFPGTGSPISVGLNRTFNFDSGNNRQLGVNFYTTDPVTVTLTPSVTTLGTLAATASGSATVTPQAGGVLQIVGSQTDVNNTLATLNFVSGNTAGTVDITMASTNGTFSDTSGDVVRLTIANAAAQNRQGGTFNAGTGVFDSSSGTFSTTRLNVVNEDDSIVFGGSDPGTAGSPAAIAPLSVIDDNTSVTVTFTAPTATGFPSGIGSFTMVGATTGVTVTGSGTRTLELVGSPAAINAALNNDLRFTPVSGVTAGNYNLTMTVADGVNTADSDNIPITIQQYTATAATGTTGGNNVSFSDTAPSILQLGRDGLTLTASNVIVSGPQVDANTRVQFYKVNGADRQLLGTAPITSFNNTTNTGTAILTLATIPSTLEGNPTTDGTFEVETRIETGTGDNPSNAGTVNTTDNVIMLYPNRAIYGVETASTSILHLINTSTGTQGNGTLTTVANTLAAGGGDITTSLAKHPTNGQVYYMDNESTVARLRRWDPTRGNVSGAYTTRGNLSFTVPGSSGLNYVFNNAPRLEFNPFGTLALYASANYISNDTDPANPLSGFYRISNFASGTPSVAQITLNLRTGTLDPFTTLANDGDLAFEPGTGHVFLTSGTRLYASEAPVGDTDTTVTLREVSGFSTTLLGSPAAMPSVSFDAGAGSILITGRYGSGSRMYRLTYSTSGTSPNVVYTAGTATQLSNGDYTSPARPMVDTTSAHN
ncbi:MAG: beta strand repeat-containing protein [Candidatus Sericytochromatia bacterium]